MSPLHKPPLAPPFLTAFFSSFTKLFQSISPNCSQYHAKYLFSISGLNIEKYCSAQQLRYLRYLYYFLKLCKRQTPAYREL